MKNMMNATQMNELSLDALDAISGGNEPNYALFDPADGLTKNQMSMVIAAIEMYKLSGTPIENITEDVRKAASSYVYDFDIAYYAKKYYDVSDRFFD